MTAPNNELLAALETARADYAQKYCNGDINAASSEIAAIVLRIEPGFGAVTIPKVAEKPDLAAKVLEALAAGPTSAQSAYQKILADIQDGDQYDKAAKDGFYTRMHAHNDSIDPAERVHLLQELRARLPGKPSLKIVRGEYELRRSSLGGSRKATLAIIEYPPGCELFQLDALLEALKQHGKQKNLFVYAHQIVEPGRHPTYGLRFAPLNHEAFAARLGAKPAIEFVQTTDDGGKRTACPLELRKAVYSQTHRLSDIEVQWISTTPIYRNGELYSTPGYYAAMRVWLEAPLGVILPSVCDRAAALEALEYLFSLIAECAFKDKIIDRAVAMAALLTAAVRGSMRCPGILITKPSNRVGASTLTHLFHIVLDGTEGFEINAAVPPVEMDKLVDTAQLEGHVAMLLDNAIHDGGFNSAALAQAITAGVRRVRVLGSSKTVPVECRQLIVVNGVKVQLTADLAERFIAVRLDPQMERPSERPYSRTGEQLFEEAKRDRVKILIAAYTILAAYHRSGEQAVVKNIAGFEEWCGTVSAALAWLGLPDVAISQQLISIEDPATQTRRLLVASWLTLFGEAEVTTHDVATGPTNFGSFTKEPAEWAAARNDLKEVLGRIATDKYTREVDEHKLGNWLGRNADRTVGQHQLINSGTAHGGCAKWQLVRVPSAAPSPPPESPRPPAGKTPDASNGVDKSWKSLPLQRREFKCPGAAIAKAQAAFEYFDIEVAGTKPGGNGSTIFITNMPTDAAAYNALKAKVIAFVNQKGAL
jgi:hypothetical protein